MENKKISSFLKFNRLTIWYFLLLITIGSISKGEEITIASDPWCPFTCEPSLEKPGLMIEVAREIFKSKGISVNYSVSAWNRAIIDTRENKLNAVAGALKSDAPDFIYPTENIAQQKSCFYVLKDSKWKYEGSNSLKNLVLGAVLDYTYGDPLDTYISTNSKLNAKNKNIDFVSGVGTTLILIRKILDHRIDVMVEDESAATYNFMNNSSLVKDQLQKVGCLRPVPLYIAFSPKNPKSKYYAEIFSNGFKKFKSTLQFKTILKKYGI